MNDIDKLYEFYKPEFEIYEGLILSSPLYTTDIILKKNYEIKPNYKNYTFSLRFIFDKDIDKATKQLNLLLKLTNNLGWFPSFISSYNINNNFKKSQWNEQIFKEFISQNFVNILFSFEAKYDILIERYPRYLYHVCNTNVKDKILENGLTPKSRSKLAYHPERVYFSLSLDTAYEFAHKIYLDKKIKNQSILKIDTIPVKYYLKVFRDPNFIGKAVYTLNHVTPYCISLEEEINF